MSERMPHNGPERIPEQYLDLFQKKTIAHLATVEPDGSPHVTPVWVDYDGQYILVNSAKGREKDRNMSERPSVALDILDPENPYRYLAVQGRVIEITEEGAREHINKLSKRYTGRENYSGPANETRRIYKIEPINIMTSG
jgi:PPOX class probable F420-dependent enzyme